MPHRYTPFGVQSLLQIAFGGDERAAELAMKPIMDGKAAFKLYTVRHVRQPRRQTGGEGNARNRPPALRLFPA